MVVQHVVPQAPLQLEPPPEAAARKLALPLLLEHREVVEALGGFRPRQTTLSPPIPMG